MRIDLQFIPGTTLQITSDPTHGRAYPTGNIQKGLILLHEGKDLCEEAVGFGIPILQRGLQTIFPGELELFPLGDGFTRGMHARFKMNLVEKITRPGSGMINNPVMNDLKNILAAMIRRFPWMRGLLTHTSNLLRASLALETTYEPADFSSHLSLTYAIDAQGGRIKVDLDAHGADMAGVTEVVVMNEQGAHFFDQYQDSDGVSELVDRIGCWDLVTAAQASFICSKCGMTFSLSQVSGARLYRGRELVGKRLAWAGFGYSFPPNLEHFSYEMMVKILG
jgi:hypothetical protein